jgi:hypothetical protein
MRFWPRPARSWPVPADVLLLGGSKKGPAFLRPALDALARTLPRNQRVEFPGRLPEQVISNGHFRTRKWPLPWTGHCG